jgi:hypothetical protein
MLQCLEKHNVKFLIVGAYAMAAHGFPRTTGDIDIWLKPCISNSISAFKAMAEFGAPLKDIDPSVFSYPGIIFQLGVAPCRIDFITEISGDIKFDDAYSSSLTCELLGLSYRYINLKLLIKNKLATGRSKDLLDVQILSKMDTNND